MSYNGADWSARCAFSAPNPHPKRRHTQRVPGTRPCAQGKGLLRALALASCSLFPEYREKGRG